MTCVVARFETPGGLLAATRAAHAAGFARTEAFTPFPLPELAESLGPQRNWLAITALATGLFMTLGTYVLQWYSAVYGYAFVVGGKPLQSAPAFMLVTFAVGVLSAVLVAVFGMIFGNRLPRPHHPAFDWPVFDRASGDSFFLLLEDDAAESVRAFPDANDAAEWQELEQPSW